MKKLNTVFTALVFAAILAGNAYADEIELVAEIPSQGGYNIDWITAIQVLDNHPDEIVFATRNQGAGCGGGSPISMWKLIRDPLNVVLKQHLSQIQDIRRSLFESSDETLFTGSGWCGYKPPYYSIDGGESWQTANVGVHPPNSTFSYVEFNGDVYAGTGYAPYHGQVYRWLDGGSWELVLDIAPPRRRLNFFY
ncbi:secreted protein [Candidatus Thiomargarita nelsonii]|uniref:Secreted protein n=1 Tax=Candidatus Thiomargarita nelsonii TaxID=1003181 RepID=A0A176RZS8_9GAMM|nr:secreted protein [Candidatus Thiomargarita nelsonii]